MATTLSNELTPDVQKDIDKSHQLFDTISF